MDSWIAAIASLRYLLLIVFQLQNIASLQQLSELLFGQRQDVLRSFFELYFLIVIDVRPLAFGEPVHKECPSSRERSTAEKDDCPVTFRSSLSRLGDALFDDTATKVGVDLTFFGPSNSVTQDRIRNPFFPGEALKPPGFEDSHKCA
jgi:hypothetical protein